MSSHTEPLSGGQWKQTIMYQIDVEKNEIVELPPKKFGELNFTERMGGRVSVTSKLAIPAKAEQSGTVTHENA